MVSVATCMQWWYRHMIFPLGEKFLLTSVRDLQTGQERLNIWQDLGPQTEIMFKEGAHSCHIMSLDLTYLARQQSFSTITR